MKSIWIVFTLIFCSLAIFHFKQSKKTIGQIKNKGEIKSFNGIKVGLMEFVDDFNKYIEELNADNKRINILQGFGYIGAALTSLFTYLLP